MTRHNYTGRERRQKAAARIALAVWLVAVLVLLTVTARAVGMRETNPCRRARRAIAMHLAVTTKIPAPPGAGISPR